MMLSRDPIQNVIHQGIKADIQHLLSAERHRGALLLTCAGIDTMAFVSMPEGQLEVRPADFIAWSDRYLELGGTPLERVSGEEMYAARCGLLHTYSLDSRMTRKGVRRLGWFAGAAGGPAVRSNAAICDSLVMVSVEGLVESFFRGIDRCLIEVFGDPARRPTAETRLRNCVHQLDQGRRVGRDR